LQLYLAVLNSHAPLCKKTNEDSMAYSIWQLKNNYLRMKEIKASNYSVFVSGDCSKEINAFFKINKNKFSKIFLLVDENTLQYCYPKLAANVKALTDAEIIEIESGEENKTIEICVQVWSTLSERGADRQSLLINIGGGVIGDMGGFIASTFKRGIPFINIPTTLLSQVDASVGGKLGIDLNHLKNEIGVFNNPQAVFVDSSFLTTLEKRQVLSGFAEIIKHALIADAAYWKKVKQIDFNSVEVLAKLIETSVNIKNNVVLADPFEKNIRKTLNFGHTIGHAIETFYLDKKDALLHGEAIAVGMICEAYLSNKVAGLSDKELKELTDYILSVYQPIKIPTKILEALLKLMQHDKKNEKGQLNFSLLSSIGKCEINKVVTSDLIQESINYYTEQVKKQK
jgi:3-dehydroquinate synthase